MKINFVSSLKICIFATVNHQYGLPRESAFCLFRVVNFDTHKNERWNREDECSYKLYSYSRHTLWGNSQTLFNLSGSRSPTTQKWGRWMAPLSSLWLNLSEPRTNKKKDGTDKMPQMRKGNERQGNKLSPMRYDNGRNKGCNGRKCPKWRSQNQPNPFESTFYRK